MSDWQVGDLALCVNVTPIARTCVTAGPELVLGKVYRVEAVFNGCFSGILMLGIEGDPWIAGRRGRDSFRFRKIRPDEHEACEPEFVTLLKRTKVTA